MPGADVRANQKTRTRRAIVEACRGLMRSGESVTMPAVAKSALVSEATAYRYFPDLTSLLGAALSEDWPSPEVVFQSIADSLDLVERVRFATRFMLEGIAERQGAVRTMIAATISQPHLTRDARPGIRFTFIDQALDPFADQLNRVDPDGYEELRRALSVIVSPEALFSLTDLYGLSTEVAIDSLVRTAGSIASSALR
jgi:AcrR family transcriptional regulator